jgi:hypothetical protein
VTVTDVPAIAGHPDIEAWLDDRRVHWTFVPELAVDSIDAAASLANQARLEPLNEEVVDRYAADMERGDRFPPIIVNRVVTRRGERLVLVGGNHRLAGAGRAKRSTLAAYVVEAEPDMVVRLTFEDNRRHGLPPSEEERLFQAAHLVATGYSQGQAAEVCGVSVGKLQRAMSLQGADRRAHDLGVKRWSTMPKTTRWRLGNIQADPVFATAAQLAVDTAMDSKAIFELVTRLNSCRSEADALAAVATEAEAMTERAQASGGGAIRKATPRSKFLSGLGSVRHLQPVDIAAACATPVQAADLSKRIDDTIKHLQAVKKALA